jgi:Ras-related protein Rab-5C
LDARRAISFEEGRDYAEEAGLIFFETSAKNFTNVTELFTALGNLLYNL